MIKIIYNIFSASPNLNLMHRHWLQSLMEDFKAISKTNSTFRVDADSRASWSSYKIRNTANRAKAICYSKDKKIYIEIYELPYPDITQCLKPKYGDMTAHGEFENTLEGKKLAAEFLSDSLENENLYTRSEQPRISLTTDISRVKEGAVFLGGIVTNYEVEDTADDVITVTIQDLKNQYTGINPFKYRLKMNRTITTARPKIGRFVIISSDTVYSFMTKDIFDLYYQFI